MNLDKKKKEYCNKVFGKEDSVLTRIHQESVGQGIENMQLSPSDAYILQFLTKSCQVKKACEIGGLFGYSGLHIARGLPSNGKLYSLDTSLERQKKAQKFLEGTPEFKKISWIHGDAKKTLHTLENQAPFDMVFIDADKASYYDYFIWAQKYLKIGGLLVVDNAFLFNSIFASSDEIEEIKTEHHISETAIEAVSKLNQEISSSSVWTSAMIPTADGLAVAYKTKEPD